MIVLAALCFAYLLGSIPTGLLVGRLKGVDVRRHGSGNVGATNVLRVAGKLPGFLVLLVDLGKGWLPVTWIASKGVSLGAGVDPALFRVLLGCAAVAGHVWNPFLGLKGGRGVATSLGVLLGLDLRVGGLALGIWLAVLWLTRYVSVASIAAAFLSPFLMLLAGRPTSWVLGAIAVALVIIWRHRPNLMRLLQGEEHRLGR